MLALAHPEVLSIDWLPPSLPARGIAVARLEQSLDPPPARGRARLGAVEGPEGSGTSSVARRAARNWLARHFGSGDGPEWKVLTVRIRPARGTTTVTGALLRHFDPGFEPRGFPAMEILAGCLRRLHREGRPAAIVLDDIDPGAPPLSAIVRGLAAPHRFLPEGDEGAPPLVVLLAGRSGALARIRRGTGLSIPTVTLEPYRLDELRTIVRERAARALGRDAPLDLADGIAGRAHEEGRGATRALDLLRRELMGGSAARPGSVYHPFPNDRRVLIEEHLLRAIDAAAQRGPPTLATLRGFERAAARAAGVSPLPSTTLWRRIVRLEQAGYLRREVRTGGFGGTQSRLYLERPVPEWVTIPRAMGTLRGSSTPFSSGPRGQARAVPLPLA